MVTARTAWYLGWRATKIAQNPLSGAVRRVRKGLLPNLENLFSGAARGKPAQGGRGIPSMMAQPVPTAANPYGGHSGIANRGALDSAYASAAKKPQAFGNAPADPAGARAIAQPVKPRMGLRGTEDATGVQRTPTGGVSLQQTPAASGKDPALEAWTQWKNSLQRTPQGELIPSSGRPALARPPSTPAQRPLSVQQELDRSAQWLRRAS